jgi:Ca2+/Na+ antiporter
MWIIQLPFIVVLCLTIPDLSKDKFKAFYPLTFFMCIVWLGVLCWLMAALATAIGCVWEIDPVVMGILLLAVGTSVPDAIASMVVAKQGEGDMAIANAIGSNVFDILLGLGTPNFLARTIPWSGKDIAGEAPGCGNDVSREMLFDLGVLYLAVVAFLGTLIFNKWKMNKTVAFFLLVIYAVYVIFTLIAEKVHGVCVFKAGDAAKKCAELLLK